MSDSDALDVEGQDLKPTVWVVCVTGIFLALVCPASADTPGPEIVLTPANQDLQVGPGVDATGRNLSGCRFVGQDLSGAKFDNADLDGAVLWDCNLQGASFRGASLRGLRTSDCYYKNCDVTNAIVNDVKAITGSLIEQSFELSALQLLTTRSYKTRDLSGCVISLYVPEDEDPVAFDFQGANLHGATLIGGDFSDTRFDGAEISGVRFGRRFSCQFMPISRTKDFQQNPPQLKGIDFRGELLGDWDLSKAIIEDCQIIPAEGHLNLAGATLLNSTIAGGSAEALVVTLNYRNRDFSKLNFSQVDFRGCDLSEFRLGGASFYRCVLRGVSFDNAYISYCRFTDDDPGELMRQIQETKNFKDGRMHHVIIEDRNGRSRWRWVKE